MATGDRTTLRPTGSADVAGNRWAVLRAELVGRRIASGLTQVEVADRVGTAQGAIAGLETGNREPRILTLMRYAEAVGCRITLTDQQED